MTGETIRWENDAGEVSLLDQTALPGRVRRIRCRDVERLAVAIRRLEIRGAPALGVAGAFGVALAAARSRERELTRFLADVAEAAELLCSTRPTAVNLSWGIDRVLSRVRAARSIEEGRRVALAEAKSVAEEDALTCRRIGDQGAALLPDRCTVLTHCNAGALATSDWGTALGVVRSAVAMGKDVRVVACETRPLLQGARLTAWELSRDGIPVTVIVDSAAASLMQSGEVDCVIVGADRIARDAVFNKVGTYMHAVCACHHGIPFYVAAPHSTFDPGSTAADIIVEERKGEEIRFRGNEKMVPDGAGVRNPAFDATPLALVTAIITEDGILRPPYDLTAAGKRRQRR
ncbi:MAG: S-methyl-5-thioribose-1-phosphate isomerase [Methanomicrobiales archaeon]|nr:S-methyl-5-thioribose-1-phosphate isomerase [Methanomicrobiales archaeon]